MEQFILHAYLGQTAIVGHYKELLGLKEDTPSQKSLRLLAESTAVMEQTSISDGEIADLIEKCRSRDRDSERILMISFRPLVRTVAGQYVGVTNILIDLVKAGSLGLQKAIEQYKTETGIPFRTFAAWYIHKAICNAFDLLYERQQYLMVERQERRLHLEDDEPSDEAMRMIIESGECVPAEYETLSDEVEEGAPEYLYLQEIKDLPIPSEAEQKELLKNARQGSEKSNQAVVEANLRLAAGIAKRYSSIIQYKGFVEGLRQVPFLDHIQSANRGLMKALEVFDPDEDHPLIPFIVWFIHKNICVGYREFEYGHRSFSKEAKLVLEVLTEYSKLKGDHEPSYEELHEAVGMAMDQLVPYLTKLREECCS